MQARSVGPRGSRSTRKASRLPVPPSSGRHLVSWTLQTPFLRLPSPSTRQALSLLFKRSQADCTSKLGRLKSCWLHRMKPSRPWEGCGPRQGHGMSWQSCCRACQLQATTPQWWKWTLGLSAQHRTSGQLHSRSEIPLTLLSFSLTIRLCEVCLSHKQEQVNCLCSKAR